MRHLSNKVVENIDSILNFLQIPFRRSGSRIVMACPIHGGDNESGLNIFLDGQTIIGNWKCWTNNCEEEHGYGIMGFLSGVLKLDKEQTNKWVNDFFKNQAVFVETTPRQQKIEIAEKNTFKIVNKMEFRKSVVIPANYYVGRGYNPNTLNKFDVGLCLKRDNRFYMRVIVPVYDEFGFNVIGQIARSLSDKCSKCGKYHFHNKPCPVNNLEKMWSEKWLNSKGFRKSQTLYNIWNAKNFIKNSKTAILVEGQGDVWRLDEAGVYNVVGMFGKELNTAQSLLLQSYGVENLVILTDNDVAGEKAREKITQKYGKTYNIRHLTYSGKDVGEMSIESINREIKSKL